MNGIPLIFNERQVKRTILGGQNSDAALLYAQARIPCTLILLNRGINHYRQQNVETLLRIGFQEIISVESSSLSYNLEDFAQRYPQVKFIVPLEKLSVGDMINLGMEESSCKHCLVIWNDLSISTNLFTPNMYEEFVAKDVFCIAPFLQASKGQSLPIVMIPDIETSLNIMPTNASKNEDKTVYPFDFIGFYDKQRFMQLGGHDYTITTPYWQNLDLSLRAWLWGEQILVSTLCKVKYDDQYPLEDITADYTQLRFFLKNCAPVFKLDYAYIPQCKFFSFSSRFSGNPFEALKAFRDARKWVFANRFRFKTDVIHLVKEWQETEEVGTR